MVLVCPCGQAQYVTKLPIALDKGSISVSERPYFQVVAESDGLTTYLRRSMRIRNHKGAAAAVSLALSMSVLSACASTSNPSADGQSTVGSLTFGNWQWLEEGRGDRMWAAVKSFENSHSGITLEKAETPFAQYADKLNTELGAGSGPDVFIVLDRQYASLAEAGVLEPLDEIKAGATLNSTSDGLAVDGKQLGLTWEQVSYGLLGNKNVMKAAGITELPTTIDELIAAGKKAEAAGFEGFAVRHQMSEFNGWAYDFPSWVIGFGGGWSDGKSLTIDSPANLKGLQAYKKVFDSGIVPIGDDASTFRSKFKENKLAFLIDNSGTPNALGSGGAITGKDIVAGPLPFPQAGAHQKLIIAVNANSKNKTAAKEFVRWVVSDAGQAALRPAIGASTMATDIALDPAYLEANPWAAAYVEIGKTSRSGIPVGFETRADEIMRSVLTGVERMIASGTDPAAELKASQAELDK